MSTAREFTAPRHHSYETIHTQYHALYSADLFTRLDAFYADQERLMRECMGNRDNYDLEGVRSVVAHWESIAPGCNAHRVALAVLSERLAEVQTHTVDVAFATPEEMQAILAVDMHNARAHHLRSLFAMREDFQAHGKRGLLEKVRALIDALCQDGQPKAPSQQPAATIDSVCWSEGWMLADVNGVLVIQRIDDPASVPGVDYNEPKFASDTEALLYVAAKASAGSKPHFAAIDKVGAEA